MRIDGGLRKMFCERIVGPHWQPIETGGTGLGVPDLNGCWNGREIWIEFKKTDHWACEVRPHQVAWAERRMRAGGAVFLAARRTVGGELWLMTGGAARVLATPRLGLRDVPEELRLGVYPGGPAQWPWPVIQGLLFPVIP